mmetsp:Transcript_18686/g.27654  ORF Transcript_18686/g.27654 Transcript_18686/m.27654 type:complete len:99 (+) Transcript_18686:835-1131(+)
MGLTTAQTIRKSGIDLDIGDHINWSWIVRLGTHGVWAVASSDCWHRTVGANRSSLPTKVEYFICISGNGERKKRNKAFRTNLTNFRFDSVITDSSKKN